MTSAVHTGSHRVLSAETLQQYESTYPLIPSSISAFIDGLPRLLDHVWALYINDFTFRASVFFEKIKRRIHRFLAAPDIAEKDRSVLLDILGSFSSKSSRFYYISTIAGEFAAVNRVCRQIDNNGIFQQDTSGKRKLGKRASKIGVNKTTTPTDNSTNTATPSNSSDDKHHSTGHHRAASSISDTWKLVHEKEGIRTYYNAKPGESLHTLLISGKVSSSLLPICALIYEIDLYKYWLPAIDVAKVLTLLNGARFQLAAQVTFKLPWPLSSREASIVGYGDVVNDDDDDDVDSDNETEEEEKQKDKDKDKDKVKEFDEEGGIPAKKSTTAADNKEDKKSSDTGSPTQPFRKQSVGIYFRSVKDGEHTSAASEVDDFSSFGLLTPAALPAGHVRATLYLGGFWLVPLSSSETLVKGVFHVDPKLPLIPHWLLNFFAERFCHALISFIRQTASKILEIEKKEKDKEISVSSKRVAGSASAPANLAIPDNGFLSLTAGKEENSETVLAIEILKRMRENQWAYGELRRRVSALHDDVEDDKHSKTKSGLGDAKKESTNI